MARPASSCESSAVLRDGTPVAIRAIRTADAASLLDFHARLSPVSRYHRFFSPVPRLDAAQLRHLVDVDHVDSFALVAEVEGRIIGVTHCHRTEQHRGDISIAIDDVYQGRGLGPILLTRLIPLARERGIRVFDADVLAENRRMLGILSRVPLTLSRRLQSGVVHFEISLDPRSQ